jgi:hypothetical protein
MDPELEADDSDFPQHRSSGLTAVSVRSGLGTHAVWCLWDLTLPLELIHVNRRRRRKPSVLRLPPVDCEIKERRACGHDGAGGKFCSKELETIGDTPSNGTANQSHCGCRTEHDPEFFGPEPTFRKKGRQERRGSSERTEKCAVEQHKSKQYAPVDSHDLRGKPSERSDCINRHCCSPSFVGRLLPIRRPHREITRRKRVSPNSLCIQRKPPPKRG